MNPSQNDKNLAISALVRAYSAARLSTRPSHWTCLELLKMPMLEAYKHGYTPAAIQHA
jgi:hypothetical protein